MHKIIEFVSAIVIFTLLTSTHTFAQTNNGEKKISASIDKKFYVLNSSIKIREIPELPSKTPSASDITQAYYPLHASTLYVDNFQISPLQDNDRDGYYNSFNVRLDLSINAGSERVYAALFYRPIGGFWQKELTTESFIIDAYGSSDSVSMDIVWDHGYDTDEYEFKMQIYSDFDSNLVLTVYSNPSILYLFESQDLEEAFYSESYYSTDTYIDEQGGTFGTLWLLGLGYLVFRKRKLSKSETLRCCFPKYDRPLK